MNFSFVSNMIEAVKKWFNDFKSVLWPACIDTLIILAFTVQPTIWVALNYWRKGETANLYDTIMGGDILLYSISLLSSSYLVYNQFRIRESDWKDMVNKLIVVIMIIISMLYTMMKGDNQTTFGFAKTISIILFVTALVSFISSQVLARKPATDVGEERRDEQQIIEDNLG